MNTTSEPYEIYRDQVASYFYWQQILFILVIGIWMFGVGLLIAIVYAISLGLWLPGAQANALKYWLDGTTLRIDQGIFFLKRKAIPLDRVTDVVLVQGPLLRACGIWALQIQTAGLSGQAVPEATLYGLRDAEMIRDNLLRARDAAVGRSSY